MKTIVLAFALSLGLAGAASAQLAAKPNFGNPPPAPTKAPVADANGKVADADKILCRDDETTGARIKTRICHTKREWAIMEGNAKDYIQNAQDHANTLCPGGSC